MNPCDIKAFVIDLFVLNIPLGNFTIKDCSLLNMFNTKYATVLHKDGWRSKCTVKMKTMSPTPTLKKNARKVNQERNMICPRPSSFYNVSFHFAPLPPNNSAYAHSRLISYVCVRTYIICVPCQAIIIYGYLFCRVSLEPPLKQHLK